MPTPPVAATMHPPERPSLGVLTAGEKKDLHFLDAQTEVMESAIVPGSLCSCTATKSAEVRGIKCSLAVDQADVLAVSSANKPISRHN